MTHPMSPMELQAARDASQSKFKKCEVRLCRNWGLWDGEYCSDCIEQFAKASKASREAFEETNAEDYMIPNTPEPTEAVNHPKHYNGHPSGIECIEIVRHFNFNVGNAIKYLWRCEGKGKHEEDLRKALWYVQDELKRLGFKP